MARSRSIPTDFFDDPDIFLCDPTSQLLLLALVLFADDHGRGLASVPWLANRLKLENSQVQASLLHLSEVELIQWYQVGRHNYYFLCHWNEWETLSRPSQPKYPAPPTEAEPSDTQAQSGPSPREAGTPNLAENLQDLLGESEKSSPEEEEEGKKNKKRREKEAEEAPSSAFPNPNTLALPLGNPSVVTYSLVGSNLCAREQRENREQPRQVDQERPPCGQNQQEMVAQLGSILQLPQNDALSRLVEEFLPDPGLSLIAEADAARAWIDDRSRNRRGTAMSLSFFRRWLKREQENREQRCREASPTRASARRQDASRRSKPGSSPLSAQAEPNPYKAFFDRRIREIETAFDAGVPMEEILSGRVSYAPSA